MATIPGRPGAEATKAVSGNAVLAQLQKKTNEASSPVLQQLASAGPPPEAQEVGLVSGLARSAAQGATFSFADEAEAGIRALVGGREGEDFSTAYRRIVGEIREQNAAFAEQNPVASTVAEIGGAIAAPGALAAGVLGRGVAAGVKGVGSFIQGSGALPGVIARSGAVGAVSGAVTGAGQAEDVGEIGGRAVQGASLGAAFGAGSTVALAAGKGAINTVRGALQPEALASRELAKTISRADVTVDQVEARLRTLQQDGRPATIADALGTAGGRALGVINRAGGKGATRIERAIRRRNDQQLNRIARNLRAFTGTEGKENVIKAINDIKKTRADAAQPLYERAYAFPAETNQAIVDAFEAFTSSKFGKKALANAAEYVDADDFNALPLMERIQAVKKAAQDAASSSAKDGFRQRAVSERKRLKGLLDVVDAENPAYPQAREIWSGGEAYQDAIELGAGIRGRKKTSFEVAEEFKGLSSNEREAYRTGAVSAIVQEMKTKASQTNNYLSVLRSQDVMDKMEVIMPRRDFQRFKKLVMSEDKIFSTGNTALGGSSTARNLSDEANAQRGRVTAIFEALRGLTPSNLFPQLVAGATMVPRKIRDTLIERQNEVLAGKLLSQDPSVLKAVRAIDPTEVRGLEALEGVQAAATTIETE